MLNLIYSVSAISTMSGTLQVLITVIKWMDNPILSTHNRQSRLSVLRFGAWLLSILSLSEFGSAFASVSPLAVSFCSLYSPVHLPFVFLSILILIPKPFLFSPI